MRQKAGRNKDHPLWPARGAVGKKAQQSPRRQPRLPHRELPDRQRMISLHHAVPTDAAATATVCTGIQQQERPADKRQQSFAAEAKLNLNLSLYVLDATRSVKFLSHCEIKPDLIGLASNKFPLHCVQEFNSYS